nr:thionin [Aegilops tauschii subsp. strangulata]
MVMMRGNNVKTLALILVVVGLVAIEQTQQVQASHCCCHLDSVPTYFDCRAKSDSTVSECCGVSAGYISDDAGFECKSGYIDIETALQAVNYCKLGCRASLCNKLTTSVAGGTDDAMERCTGGCHDLCTRNNAEVATVRDA